MIIKQIRYYDEGDNKLLNQPSDITAEKLVSGDYFAGIDCQEIQIKTYPGTKLTINGESVYIGETGVYNILYREKTTVSSLKIDADSIEFIKNNPKEFFVITFILDEKLEEQSSSDSGKDESDSEGGNVNPGEEDTQPADDKEKDAPKDNHDN